MKVQGWPSRAAAGVAPKWVPNLHVCIVHYVPRYTTVYCMYM